MDPKGKATAPTPRYGQDAKKGYLPSDDLLHAGPEPSGYAPRSFLSGNSLDMASQMVGVDNIKNEISRSHTCNAEPQVSVLGEQVCETLSKLQTLQLRTLSVAST